MVSGQRCHQSALDENVSDSAPAGVPVTQAQQLRRPRRLASRDVDQQQQPFQEPVRRLEVLVDHVIVPDQLAIVLPLHRDEAIPQPLHARDAVEQPRVGVAEYSRPVRVCPADRFPGP